MIIREVRTNSHRFFYLSFLLWSATSHCNYCVTCYNGWSSLSHTHTVPYTHLTFSHTLTSPHVQYTHTHRANVMKHTINLIYEADTVFQLFPVRFLPHLPITFSFVLQCLLNLVQSPFSLFIFNVLPSWLLFQLSITFFLALRNV